MSPSPNLHGLLLCAAVLSCTTVSDALILLILLPIQLLVCLLFAVVLSRLHLSTQTIWVFAMGSGITLLRLTALTPYPTEITLLAMAAFLLCGALAPSLISSPPPPATLWRTAAVMLLIGIIRELLTYGTIGGVTLITPLPVTSEPVGAFLLAACLLWLFRLSVPVTGASDCHISNTVWLTLAVCSAKALTVAFLPSLTDAWVMGITVLTAALLSQAEPLRTAWAPLTPVIAIPVSDGWWHALTAAAVTALVLSVAALFEERFRRVPIARSFSGGPAALTLAAVSLCVISSF